MRVNKKMEELLSGLPLDYHLHGELAEIVESGFTRRDACIFLSALFKPHYADYGRQHLFDETGLEAFVNSIHIEDFEERKSIEAGVALVKGIFDVWKNSREAGKLLSSMSVDGKQVVVKFYLDRVGQQYLSPDLENFEEAVLEISVNDVCWKV